jgi:hypothetical protein
MAIDSAGQREVSKALGGDSTLADLQEEFRKFKNARAPFEPDWFLNTAFYVGQQWLYWNGSGATGRLDRPILAKHRETIVDNRILPIVTARAARKVKNRPSFIATPFTGSESDVDAARITEKVMERDWVYLDLQQKLFQAELFADIVCAGFWKVYWDSTKGDAAEFVVNPDGEPLKQQNGAPVKPEMFPDGLPEGLGTKTIAVGDVCVEVVSPFNFYPDPLATSMSELEFCFEEKVRSPEYIQERYDVDLEPDSAAPTGPVESRLFASQMPAGAGDYQGVKLIEGWGRPSSKFPKGKRVVWARDQVLYEDSEPSDPMPYVMFSGIKVPNRFWPTAITTQLRGPQVNLNKIKSQIQENANRIGNPALMKSRQANVYYTGAIGEEILYDSTVTDAVPQYLQAPPMQQYVLEQEQKIVDSMTEIAGQREVSNATVPTGVTAASAINLLQEADDTRIGPEIQDMEFALGQAGTKVARLRAQFNSDERLMRIAGEDENWDIFAFRGAMMGKDPTVECQAGSAMPRSKAAKQAAMLEVLQTAFQYGIQFDPRDLRRFFKDYEVGALDRLFGTLSTTEQQIQRENRQMSQGIAVEINDYDEAQDHIDGHEEFQRTARFQQLEPQAKQAVQLHVNAHREKIVNQINAQVEGQRAEQMAAAQGAHQQELQTQAHGAALDVAKQHAAPPPQRNERPR